jgi:hypothetical protein
VGDGKAGIKKNLMSSPRYFRDFGKSEEMYKKGLYKPVYLYMPR